MTFTLIDSDNYAAAGIETLFFPGGEPHAKVPLFKEAPLLHLKLRTWTDVGFAACVMSALTSQHVAFKTFMPYFPGARQDRSDGTAPLTVGIMSYLLVYSRDFYVFDPHSAAIHRHMDCHQFMPSDLPIATDESVRGVIAPDKGAVERATQYRDYFCPGAPVIECTKTRDPHTGRLGNYYMPVLPRSGRYIVVDDICDGGGTFNLLADAWAKDPYAARSTLELFVSHGIFSRGLEALSPHYARITTTDSWCRAPSGGRLTVIPLLPSLLPKMEHASHA